MNLHGESLIKEYTYDHNITAVAKWSGSIILPTGYRRGYTFEGWSITKGSDKSDYKPNVSITNITKNTTLYAVWKPIKYIVRLHHNTLDRAIKSRESHSVEFVRTINDWTLKGT